ncbi:MAG TPA: tail fiber protein [Candidatus Sulfotelmatobacter sp.]|nr:tail fiber protein [Candidatus Sulfotelmatobacter sp.]
MSTPFLTEIRIFSFSFAPKNWQMCNGQTLPINTYPAMFSLIGTTYGGNGTTTFGLPNLQGRVAMHVSSGYVLGGKGGEESHLLTQSELPAHLHFASADGQLGDANSVNMNGAYPAYTTTLPMYSAGSSNMVSMSPSMVTSYGSGGAHENRQPFLVLNYCIAVAGIFPSRN